MFNIANDPREQNDEKAANPGKATELQNEFDAMDSKMPDLGLFPVPFTRLIDIELGEEYMIEDFEGSPLSSILHALGKNVTVEVVDNPLKDEVNSTDKVLKIHRPADNTQTWAGMWMNISTIPKKHDYIHMKVLKTRKSVIRMKLEECESIIRESTNAQTKVNEWEDFVFDFSETSNRTIPLLNIQPDYTNEFGDYTIYIDEVFINNNSNTEPMATSVGFFDAELDRLYFYPNPVKDYLRFEKQVVNATIKIWSLDGRCLMIEKNVSDSLNVSNLNSGQYVIVVESSKGEIKGLFVKI